MNFFIIERNDISNFQLGGNNSAMSLISDVEKIIRNEEKKTTFKAFMLLSTLAEHLDRCMMHPFSFLDFGRYFISDDPISI